MKKSVALILALSLLILLTGCGRFEKGVSEVLDEAVEETVENKPVANGQVILPEDGYGYGKIGDTFQTAFFDFSVISADTCDSYEGYSGSAQNKLIDVVVNLKNTFGEELPMFNSDFQIQWHDLGDKSEDYGHGIYYSNSKTVMPDEYYLALGETVTYHIVFEVPDEAEEFSVSYLEYFDDETTGDAFFCFFEED